MTAPARSAERSQSISAWRPAILRSASLRIAVVVINPDERPQSAMLAMSDGVSAVSEYALARPAVERHAGSPIPLQLGAHDVRVYVSEPVAP